MHAIRCLSTPATAGLVLGRRFIADRFELVAKLGQNVELGEIGCPGLGGLNHAIFNHVADQIS